jgi:predicted CXXCH cytochrome family protein
LKRISGLTAGLRGHRPRGFAVAALVAVPALAGAWLFLAALPAMADGGPHVSSANSGQSTLTTDGCAGCHRAHTAQGPMLIDAPDEESLCVSCHGATGTGATTDVMTGIQYRPGTGTTVRGGAELGALRSGGFEEARIATATPARVIRSQFFAANQWAKVGVGAPTPVTSAHLDLAGSGLTLPGKAWGNGDTGAGPSVALGCASCHNPHGNGQYRILNPVPSAEGSGFTAAGSGVAVTDSDPDNPDPTESDTKNYTVLQTQGTPGTPSTYLLYADDVIDAGWGSATGDYWHVRVPWNSTTAGADAPNGIPSGATTSFNAQITAWCSACHTRYYSVAGDADTLDPVYRYRHETTSNRACTTCHVAHGSNASMSGDYSSTFPYPDNVDINGVGSDTSSSSRLLKVDDRGTCQLCHDPTHTVANGQYTGPLPTPGIP